jgi:hypothetical protein
MSDLRQITIDASGELTALYDSTTGGTDLRRIAPGTNADVDGAVKTLTGAIAAAIDTPQDAAIRKLIDLVRQNPDASDAIVTAAQVAVPVIKVDPPVLQQADQSALGR